MLKQPEPIRGGLRISDDFNKRYLFASVDAPPRIGGVAALAQNLAHNIAKNHATEAVFVGPAGTWFPDGVSFKTYEDFASATDRRDGPFARQEDERIEELFGAIIERYSINRIMLLHPFYYGLAALNVANAHGIPLISYVHGTELTSQFPKAISEPISAPLDPGLETLAGRLHEVLNGSSVILCNSAFTARVASGIAPGVETVVTGCGLDEATVARERRLSPTYRILERKIRRERLGLSGGPTMVSVGRLVPHKRVEFGIRMLTHLPKFQLVVIGDGPALEKLKQVALELGVSNRVRFAGEVSEDDKWKYLRAADFGLLLSTHDPVTNAYEGFGIVMLEYTAAGCLPVTSGQHGMADFSTRFNAGLVCCNDEIDEKTSANLLEELATNEEKLTSRVKYAREVLEARYIWSKVADAAAL